MDSKLQEMVLRYDLMTEERKACVAVGAGFSEKERRVSSGS
jgi:hypothetical protein